MKNKNILIAVLAVIIVVIVVVAVAFKVKEGGKIGTDKKTNTASTTIASKNNDANNTVQDTPKNEQTGTAGSNIPLKDNLEEAKHQIEIAMQNWLKEAFGDEIVDSKITVTKVYTAEEEQEEEALKEKKLGPNEVAFEVNYEIKLAEGVTDTMKFTASTGVYNKETRWVTEKFNLGILRPDGNGYKITDFGTGW